MPLACPLEAEGRLSQSAASTWGPDGKFLFKIKRFPDAIGEGFLSSFLVARIGRPLLPSAFRPGFRPGFHPGFRFGGGGGASCVGSTPSRNDRESLTRREIEAVPSHEKKAFSWCRAIFRPCILRWEGLKSPYRWIEMYTPDV